MGYKTLFIILDGVGDHIIKTFHGKTPLEAAKKPNIDKLCRFAECGVVSPVDIGVVPGSDTGHLGLFGYDPYRYYPGRGVFEALGLNIKLEEGDIAFRVNFGTVDNNFLIIDRRAQRNPEGIDSIIKEFNSKVGEIESKYGVKIILKHGVEHRGVLVIKGKNLSNKISDIDVHKVGIKAKEVSPLNDTKSARITAEIVNKIISLFYDVSKNHVANDRRKEKGLLPVNYLLLRGVSMYKPLKDQDTFYSRYQLKPVFIAGAPMYLGVAKYVGMDTIKPAGATGTVNTSLVSKAESAISARQKYDIIFVHIKATDTLSHDKNPKGKKKFIELIDQRFFSRIKDEFDIIVLTSDHTTSSILGEHTADPVPIMIYSVEDIIHRKDSVKNFAERKCYKGILGHLKGIHIIRLILNKIGKGIKYGT
ncbi:MAG TPA: 2,3-bisphosphoglycerate-independent phosphoglycerate mutase [Candidatus Nanopusillus sp.]|nr:2,3-bisphosphoglycerate-independent phosphoglycerate mutase [Candidatus Nanopusillus sp.]HIP90007.1 2,3-bisphosphoglycerate-independent phosphoglycerate mutase [Candidatus Nanopusillus sp.]